MDKKVPATKTSKGTVAQPTPPPVPPPEKHTPKSPLLWFGIGLLMVVLGGGYYLLSYRTPQVTQQPTTPLPSPVVTSPIIGQTVNETYTNTRLGFSLQLPPGFNAYETTEGPAAGERVDFAINSNRELVEFWFWVSASPNSNKLTAEQVANNYLNAKSSLTADGNYISIAEQPEVMSKIEQRKLQIGGKDAVSLYRIPSQSDTKITYVTTPDWVYSIVVQAGTLPNLNTEAMTSYDLILSTFRFVE